jgi:xylulokinase
MADGSLLLGIDVSTTGAKALLIDTQGRVVSSATIPLTLSTLRPLWSEQAPEDWYASIARSIHDALRQADRTGADVAAIGLTGQMHGLVTLDDAGNVLRPAILWNDQRTAAQCDEIRARVGRERLIAVTGNDALTGFTAPKILWVREEEPEVYARLRHILLPKDYVRYRLTGEYAMDKADGSGTLLFDLRARDWSSEVLDALEIPHEWLPPTYEGPQVTGRVSAEAAAATGLVAGTPVVAGGGDQAAGGVGVGAIAPGVVSVVLGTSGVVFAPTDAPLIEPEGRVHAFCHALPERWHLMGVTLSAAGSLQWYRDTLAPGVPFDDLLAEAEEAPAASDGLLFLPYLAGERTPYPDPLARGAFVGLTLRTRRAQMTRAVLEGVAFSLKDCFGLLEQAGLGAVTEARVSGGGARSHLWRRILASALGVALVSLEADEGAALGAALLAGIGIGVWPDAAAAVGAGARLGARVEPDTADAERYTRLYADYRALYPALRPTFTALSGPTAQ